MDIPWPRFSKDRQGDIAESVRLPLNADEARRAVLELAGGDNRVDLIKVVQERGRPERPLEPIHPDVLQAIVAEAHHHGIPVFAHWGTLEDLEEVLAADVDGLEHVGRVFEGWPERVIRSLVERQVSMTPTLAAMEVKLSRRHEEVSAASLRIPAALFAAKGFDGTTTAEICKAAAMSSGNLFHYFQSKRDIFAAIFADEGNEKAERLAAAEASGDPWRALLDVVDLLAAPATAPLAPALVMEAMVQAGRDPELEKLLGRDDAREHAAIESLVIRAAAAGQIDPTLNASDTASWIMTLIGALYIRAAIDPQFKPAEQVPFLRLILERFVRPER